LTDQEMCGCPMSVCKFSNPSDHSKSRNTSNLETEVKIQTIGTSIALVITVTTVPVGSYNKLNNNGYLSNQSSRKCT
jgi:hypothetical protein